MTIEGTTEEKAEESTDHQPTRGEYERQLPVDTAIVWKWGIDPLLVDIPCIGGGLR